MIILYTTKTCPKCKVLKMKLKGKNIRFQEIDIGALSSSELEEVGRAGNNTVPVMRNEGELLSFVEATEWTNNYE